MPVANPTPRPKHPDSVVKSIGGTRCLVGKSPSGWTWVCLTCTSGGILGRNQSYKGLAELAARNHRCEVEVEDQGCLDGGG